MGQMSPMTVQELRLRQAQLACRAERLRQEWRTLPVGPRAAKLGKQVRAVQQQADDYAEILRMLAPAAGETAQAS